MPRKSYTTNPNSIAKRGETSVGPIDGASAVREISRQMTPMALETLRSICLKSRNDSARSSAAREILDRAWGKTRIEAADTNEKQDTRIQIVFGADHKSPTIESAVVDVDADEEDE